MYLPTTYGAALLLTILTMICWGSWANTQKMAGKWRFELFYLDYSFGGLICAVVAMFTVGAMNPNDITAMDNLSFAAWRKIAYGLAGGVVFNLANMLLVAAISIAGLAVAFPVGIGLALVIGVVWNYVLNPQGNPALLFTGSVLVLGATIVNALAYKRYAAEKGNTETSSAMAAAAPLSKKRPSVRQSAVPEAGKATPTKGIVLSIVAGLLMGSFYPLVATGMESEIGLASYGIAFVFALGVFFSTFIFTLFFALMPVYGEPIALMDYFKGSRRQHTLGLAGGIIWMVGAIANFTASGAPASVQVGPAVSYAIGQGATMVSVLWGLLVWKEFAGAGGRVKMLLALMFVLFITGLGLVSIAPLYSHL